MQFFYKKTIPKCLYFVFEYGIEQFYKCRMRGFSVSDGANFVRVKC